MKEKESFILYNSFYEPIKALKNEQLGKLLRAIFDYTINGEITQDNEIIVAFMFIKNQLDRDSEKWEDERNKRKEAGRLGGIKRALNQQQKLSSKSKQCLGVLKSAKQSQANQADNVDVNVYVDVNDNVNVNDNNIYNTSINNNINTTTSTNNIYNYIEENFGRTLSPVEYEQISKWEDNELTRYAIKQAVLNGAYRIKYIESILNDYEKNGIKTIQEAQEKEKEFKKIKEEKNKYKGLSFREQERLREEQAIKEWLEEE